MESTRGARRSWLTLPSASVTVLVPSFTTMRDAFARRRRSSPDCVFGLRITPAARAGEPMMQSCASATQGETTTRMRSLLKQVAHGGGAGCGTRCSHAKLMANGAQRVLVLVHQTRLEP